jgi:uncharacterized heparinase superfamily protein
LLYLLSVLCDEPLWVITDFQQKEDSFVDITFLLGKPKGRRIAAFNGTAAADIVSRSFISSGWYLLRAKDIYCFINAGALEKSAHRNFMHNDKLSFELMLNGEEVVVDPGTYTFYDLKERDAFRTTAAHAALVVRDEEQNMFGRSKVLDFGEEETGFWFEAEYDGYRQSGFIQRRRIELIKAKRELKVTDILVGNISKVRCINNVVLSPSLDILRLNIQPQGNININDSAWYSPEYGIKIPTKRLEISALSYTISIINKAEDIPRP